MSAQQLRLLAATTVWCFGWASYTTAADRPAWYCLPEETYFVVRVPNLAGFAAALHSRTKLGTVLGTEQRLTDLKKLLYDETKDEWDSLVESLAKLGLSPEDFIQTASVEWGYAEAVAPLQDGSFSVGLGWVECGEIAAEKWQTALDRKLVEQPDDKEAVRREDLDLADTKVIHLIIPQLTATTTTAAPKADVILKPADPEAAIPKLADEKPVDDRIEIDRRHLMLARRNGRILSASFAVEPGAKQNPPVIDDAEMIEKARDLFARFLANHQEDGEGVVGKWRQTPGLVEALPDGEILVDVLVDIRRIIGFQTEFAPPEVKNLLRAAGAEALGPLGYRIALDGAVLRSGMFLSAPAPRSGLLELLDRTTVKPEPAEWVRNDVIGYQHIGLDLAEVYRKATSLIREHYPRGQGALNTLETQAQAFLQTDPTTILGSLGKTHTILSYVPATTEPDERRRISRDDPGLRTALAFVWTVPDEGLWKRFMTMTARAANRPLGVEQGFVGLRYEQGTFTAGWFVGNGYMVAAIGKGVIDKVISNLRTPPRVNEALRSAPFARRGAELLDVKAALSYDVTDGAAIQRFADSMMQHVFAEEQDVYAAKLMALWPTEQEWQGTIGVSVSALSVGPEGLFYRSAFDLPPP